MHNTTDMIYNLKYIEYFEINKLKGGDCEYLIIQNHNLELGEQLKGTSFKGEVLNLLVADFFGSIIKVTLKRGDKKE